MLDACALIAYLREEPGNDVVADLFSKAAAKSATIFVHKVTLTEVLYDMLRTDKSKTSTDLINDIYLLPINLIDTLSNEFIGTVAYFKANHKVSFADCFVLAVAKEQDATIVSSDHHEFYVFDKSGELRLKWIR